MVIGVVLIFLTRECNANYVRKSEVWLVREIV